MPVAKEKNMENEVLSQELTESSVNSDDGLFSDWSESDDMPVEEETTDAETIAEEETPAEEPFLKIQYDKQEYGLTRDEAKELAEKGKNYDRMRDKYNTLHDQLERLASLNEMSVDDYLGRLNSTQFDYMVNKEFGQLREQYPNDSDDVLREIAESRVNNSLDLRERKAQEQIQNEVDEQQMRVQRDVDKFLEEYPEFKNKGPDVIDPQVFELVKKGYTLLEAYNKWSRESPSAVASKLNEENKRRSLGSTSNAGRVEGDDFLNGFFSD